MYTKVPYVRPDRYWGSKGVYKTSTRDYGVLPGVTRDTAERRQLFADASVTSPAAPAHADCDDPLPVPIHYRIIDGVRQYTCDPEAGQPAHRTWLKMPAVPDLPVPIYYHVNATGQRFYTARRPTSGISAQTPV